MNGTTPGFENRRDSRYLCQPAIRRPARREVPMPSPDPMPTPFAKPARRPARHPAAPAARWFTRAALTALAATLLACGGGGAGGGGDGGNFTPSPGGGSGGSGGGNPGAGSTGFEFATREGQANAADFLEQVTSQGDLGFRFRSTQAFADQQIRAVYIKDLDGSSLYEHKTLPPSDNVDELVRQADEQGALGFRFRGNLVFDPQGAPETVALYTRDTDVAASYRYEAMEPTSTEASRLAQLNAQGGRGYRFISDFVFDTSIERSLYARDTNDSARYVYRLLELPGDETAFLALLNDEGATGYRYRSPLFLPGDSVIRGIFVERTDQSGRFEYSLLDIATSAQAFVDQANEQGSRRILHQGDIALGGSIRSLYVDLSACGCMALRLADPFTD